MNNRFVLAIAFAALLLFSSTAGLALANFMPPPPELPYVYIRADGSLDPQTLPVQRVGDTYTLTGNLANRTLAVQRNNIVVDGAGYTLLGNGTGKGIVLTNVSGITVKNVAVRNFHIGIDSEQSSSNTLIQNEIADNEVGVVLSSSSNNTIGKNNIAGNLQGITALEYSSYNSIAENHIAENENAGLVLEFDNNHPSNCNEILRNNVTSNGMFGVRIDSSSNCLIRGNTIANHEYGLKLAGSACQNNLIVGNIITNSKYGVAMGGDFNHNTVTENTIAHNEIGFDIFGSNNNEFYRNDFVDNTKQVNNGVNATLGVSVNSWSRENEGNFWSDYTGTDANHDGIGDDPYVIDSVNKDNYPLITLCNGSPQPQFPQNILAMTEEFINYTITNIDDALWAKIDGTYPMHLYTQKGRLPMVYPTPPGTTNIQVTLDGRELSWTNYSAIDPTVHHHTAIGDWTMIYCVLAPDANDFVLKIHYEHPVAVINGSYTFLYDLNISPYLSPLGTSSTAYFNISMETDYENLQAYTTASEPWTPKDFSIKQEDSAKLIRVIITSEYQRPLHGDLAVIFTSPKATNQQQGFLGSNLPMQYGYAVVAAMVVVAALVASLMIHIRRKPQTSPTVENHPK